MATKKLSAEDFVKSILPKAKSERQTTNGGESYYLIREGMQTMYLASGKTKSEAWENAKMVVEKYNLKTK